MPWPSQTRSDAFAHGLDWVQTVASKARATASVESGYGRRRQSEGRFLCEGDAHRAATGGRPLFGLLSSRFRPISDVRFIRFTAEWPPFSGASQPTFLLSSYR